jgi:hypothetical protein
LIPLIFELAKNECKAKAFVLPETVEWKVTLDGRIIGKRREVLLSIVPRSTLAWILNQNSSHFLLESLLVTKSIRLSIDYRSI